MATFSLVLLYLSLLIAAYVLIVKNRRKSKCPLPPGPPGLPIIGNGQDVPASHQWIEFARLSKIYGPVVHLRVLTQHVIVLSSLDAIWELLDTRGGTYSDRPTFEMLQLMGWLWIGSLIPYDETWRAHRRVYHHYFHEGASKQYLELQTTKNLVFLRGLLQSPSRFMHHIHHMTASTILSMAYGIEVSADNDPWVKLAGDAMEQMTAAGLPGSYAVDWVPTLKYIPSWFPGASFKRVAQVSQKLAEEFLFSPLSWVKEQIRAGKSGSSIAASLLQNGLEERPLPEELIASTVATIYIGGADTTVSLISAFILCMVLYPSKQRAAQEELDRVLGQGRLPEFADRETLPYVSAVMLEVIRLFPVLPLSLPHRAMEEDEYQGMRIPKGSTILPNLWSILRDEKHYANPEEFSPERFLANGRLDLTAVLDPRLLFFGFGRRICPGRHFADSSAWLAISTVLSCFNIAPSQDENGKDILPTGAVRSGAVTCPLPFLCEITLRFSETERMLDSVVDNI